MADDIRDDALVTDCAETASPGRTDGAAPPPGPRAPLKAALRRRNRAAAPNNPPADDPAPAEAAQTVPPVMLASPEPVTPPDRAHDRRHGGRGLLTALLAGAASIAWVGGWSYQLVRTIGLENLPALPPAELAGYASLLLTFPALAGVMASHLGRGRQLNRQTEELMRHLVTVSEVSGGMRTNALIDALRQTETTLRHQIGLLDDASTKVVALSGNISSRMDEQCKALQTGSEAVTDHAERTRAALLGLAGDLNQRIREMGEGAKITASALTDVGETLERRGRHVSEMGVDATMLLASVGESFAEQIARLRESVAEAGRSVEDLMAQVRDAEHMMERQTGALDAAAGKTAEWTGRLSGAIDAQRALLEEGDRRIAERVEHTRATLDSQARDLERLVAMLADAGLRLNEAGAQVDARIGALEDGGAAARRVLEQTGAAFASTSEALSGLTARAEETAGCIEAVSHSLIERTGSLDDVDARVTAIEQAVTRLAEAGASIGSRIEILAQGADTAVLTLDNAGNALENRAALLADIVDRSKQEMAGYGDALDEHGRTIAGMAGEASRHLDAVGQKLNSTAALLQAISDQAADRIEDTVHSLDDRSRALDAVGDKLGSIADRVVRELGAAGAAIEQGSAAIDSAATGALARLNEVGAALDARLSTLQTLSEGTGETEERVNELRAAIEQTIAVWTATFEQASTQLSGPARQMEERAHALDALAAAVAERLDALDGILAGRTQGLLDAAAQASRDLTEAGSALESHGQGVEAAVSQAAARLGETGGMIDARLEALDAGIERADRTLSGAGARFVEQAGIVAEAAQRATGGLGLASDALDKRTTWLNEVVAAALRHLQTVGDALQSRADTLETVADRAANRVDSAALTFEERGQTLDRLGTALDERLSAIESGLNQAGQTVEERLSALTDVAGRTTSRLSELAETLACNTTGLTDQVSAAEERLTAARAGLEAAHEQIQRLALEDHERLTALVDELRARIEYATTELTGHLCDAGDTLRGAADVTATHLAEAANRMAEPAVAAADALKRRVEDIAASLRTAGQTTKAQLDALGETLMDRLAEIGATGSGAASQLTGLAEAMAATARDLAATGADTEARLSAARDALTQGLDNTRLVADAWADQVEGLSGQLDDQGRLLLSRASQIGDAAREACTILEDHAGRLESLTATAQERIGGFDAALAQAGEKASDAVILATARLEETIQFIPEQIDRIDRIAKLAMERLTLVAGELEEPSESLNDITQAMSLLVSESERATELFRKHTDALNEAAERARQLLEKTGATLPPALPVLDFLPDDDSEDILPPLPEDATIPTPATSPLLAKTDGFLRECGQVIEGLEDLALTIGSQLVTVTEQNWKTESKAERGALVKRLVDTWDDQTSVEIETRHGVDTSFRERIEEYLEGFETLFAQQSRHGMPNVLNSVFLSSDLGRFYIFLARAIGRLRG